MKHEISLGAIREIVTKIEDRYPEDVFQDIGGRAMRHACRVLIWEINEYLELPDSDDIQEA